MTRYTPLFEKTTVEIGHGTEVDRAGNEHLVLRDATYIVDGKRIEGLDNVGEVEQDIINKIRKHYPVEMKKIAKILNTQHSDIVLEKGKLTVSDEFGRVLLGPLLFKSM